MVQYRLIDGIWVWLWIRIRHHTRVWIVVNLWNLSLAHRRVVGSEIGDRLSWLLSFAYAKPKDHENKDGKNGYTAYNPSHDGANVRLLARIVITSITGRTITTDAYKMTKISLKV
jgi:hypothetical protein